MRGLLRWMSVLIVCAACWAAPDCAAAQEFSLSVCRADGVGERVDMWRREGGQRYLFLPAYMRGQPLELTYEGAQQAPRRAPEP